jgi:hypothetical protein
MCRLIVRFLPSLRVQYPWPEVRTVVMRRRGSDEGSEIVFKLCDVVARERCSRWHFTAN